MIDFNKFTKKIRAIVPITNGDFQYMRKKYRIGGTPSGWYDVELDGNIASICNPVPSELAAADYKNNVFIRGYTYNNNIIFQNFDVGKRKTGSEVMVDLNFNMVPTFSSVRAILWEDRKLYYMGPDYTDTKIFDVKAVYDNTTELGTIKGLTPELKTLHLFHDIERQHILAEQERIRKQQEIEEFKKTLRGRLMLAFNRVGASVLNYSVTSNRVTVDWRLPSGMAFNSVIDSNNFSVIEAGYCMNGADRNHSVTSMVELAKDYEEDNLIYHTRH